MSGGGENKSGWLRKHRGKWIAALLLLAAAGTAAWLVQQGVTREDVVEFGRRVPAWALLAAFFVLPLVGAPISLFLLLIGIRLGFGWGMAATTVAVIFHNFAAYRLTHGLFRQRVRDWCERRGHAIPPLDRKHQAWFTAVFAAVHGPPYAMKLYLLALTDVPLRIYLWVGAPVYIFFCIIPIGFGHAFTEMNLGWIILIGTILLGTVVLGRWLKGRMSGGAEESEPGGAEESEPAGQ